MSIRKILVTGANGQLGWELAQAAPLFPAYEFVFVDRTILDLSKPESFHTIIKEISPDAIINTAAYTAVDKAEIEKELAYTINALAVQEFAIICKQLAIPFITYSTDYVFNGNATSPYLTDMSVDPVNYYGTTKAAGEQLAMAANEDSIIIRTSWVFSAHGNNFVKTMMRLMKERASLSIVGDQQGRPTYAKDLANATIQILRTINEGQKIKGIYHYANTGATTWFGFAEKIKALAGLKCELTAINTHDFPTPAKRPSYSILDTNKIESELSISIPNWENALSVCMRQIEKM
jgi:dTDP-4-dehydrorhamnose reductase